MINAERARVGAEVETSAKHQLGMSEALVECLVVFQRAGDG